MEILATSLSSFQTNMARMRRNLCRVTLCIAEEVPACIPGIPKNITALPPLLPRLSQVAEDSSPAAGALT